MNRPDIGIVAVDPEVLFVAAIFRQRIEARCIDRQPPLRVEHLDRAEMLGRHGVIEQDQMQDGPADAGGFRQHDVGDDRAQRQIVELDIAADIGIDAGGEILDHLLRQRLLAAAHVEQHAGADGGKADHRRHRRGDQKSHR